jgi:hypothetical protein
MVEISSGRDTPCHLRRQGQVAYIIAAVQRGGRVLHAEFTAVDEAAVARGENLTAMPEIMDLAERVRLWAELRLAAESTTS